MGRKKDTGTDGKRTNRKMELMEPTNTNDERIRYERAKKRAKAIRSFYINLICYCVAIPTLAIFNIVYSPEFLWFFFSAIGWGIGLTFHAMEAFNYHPFLGKDWERRKFNELLEKENQKKK